MTEDLFKMIIQKKFIKIPSNPYVAKLFGEVNVFSDEEKAAFGLSKNFWYPNEIKISHSGKKKPEFEMFLLEITY